MSVFMKVSSINYKWPAIYRESIKVTQQIASNAWRLLCNLNYMTYCTSIIEKLQNTLEFRWKDISLNRQNTVIWACRGQFFRKILIFRRFSRAHGEFEATSDVSQFSWACCHWRQLLAVPGKLISFPDAVSLPSPVIN